MEIKNIRILIADDHDIVLEGYKSIFKNIENMHIVGEANNGLAVLELLKFNEVDVVLLDLNMPKMDGIETTKTIKIKYPNVKILILTMFGDVAHFKQLIELDVNGYLLKNSDKQTLIHAIKTIYEGKSFFDGDVTKMIINKFKQTLEIEKEVIKLSNRELEIITLVAQGNPNSKIAETLFLSPHTIKTHRKNINFKLNIHSSTELINFAIKNN